MNNPKTDAETLLLVDDTPDNLIVMKKVLQRALPQVEIVTFQNPAEVMDYVRTANVSAAIFDVQMPVLNGIELCQKIKSTEETQHIPVILVTSHEASSGFKTKGLDAGADDFLTRPIDNEELVARVKVALRINRAEAQLRRTADQVQQDYQLLFETEPECVKIVSPEGVLLNMNPAGLKMIGAESLAQAQSQPLIELVAPEYQAAFLELLGQVMTGQSGELEFECIGLKGGRCWLESHAVPLWDAENSRTNMLSVTRDITERKQAAEALQASESYLRTLINTIPDLVWLKNPEGVYLSCNSMFENLYGAKEEAIVGKTDYDLVSKEVADCFRDHDRKTMEDGGSRVNEEHVTFPGTGYEGEFETIKTPMYDSEGKLLGVLGVARDITESRQAEETLAKTEAKQAKMVANIGDVIVIIDQDGINRYKSQNVEKWFGWSPEDLVGNATLENVHPDDLASVQKIMGELMGEPNASQTLECRYRCKDESYKWIEMTAINLLHDPDICGLLGNYHDITERKQAEKELSESEIRFKALHNATFGGIAIHDKGIILECNLGLSELTGYSADELIGMDGLLLLAEESREMVREHIISGHEAPYEAVGVRKNGEEYPLRLEGRNIPYGGKDVRVVEFRDITEQKTLEEQFRQSQKMESVGQLAGGVAHDFNNMLQAILGHAELALRKIDPSDPLLTNLQEIQSAAQRSGNLTRQLLAFARVQTIAPVILDLNDEISNMLNMLQRLLREEVTLTWQPGTHLNLAKLDPSQIDQILVNLCVNAQDAICGNGEIIIKTKNKKLDGSDCKRHAEAVPGDYVVLTVSDTGCGMDAETLGKLFEPFFTTKEVGGGTGLGLATVYGIVKQNNGFITVYSEPGQGTTFKIYLPQTLDLPQESAETDITQLPGVHGETVLLVEDEPSLRNLYGQFLEALGYTVLTTETPQEALELFSKHPDDIQLLLTDVVMPGMNGKELADAIRENDPSIKVLFMSGYTADIIADRGVLEQDATFISKPFSCDDLARKVHDVLNAKLTRT